MPQLRNTYDVIAMGGEDASLVTFLATYTNLSVAVFGRLDHHPNQHLTQAHGAAFGFDVFPELTVLNHISHAGQTTVSLSNGRCLQAQIAVDSDGKVMAGDLETMLSAAEIRLLHKMNNLRLIRSWHQQAVSA